MPIDQNELKRAVHLLMNDVVEHCFENMINNPDRCDDINAIIRDASNEINYQCLKIDAHNFKKGSKEAEEHYRAINHDIQRKSLELLSRLQKIQRGVRVNGDDE